jgi:hypothetical protein
LIVEEKYEETQRIAKLLNDHRLDYTEAIGMVIDVMPLYDPELHSRWAPRKFFREFCPQKFAWIQNANVAVKAYEILKAEAHAE